MMSGDYRVGDLSNLLQPKEKAGKSGNDTDEKLQSLFSSKPQVSAKVQAGTNAAKVKKRKQKIMNEDNATSHGEDDIPKKKKRKDKSDINTPIETIPESSSPQKKRKSGKIQKKKKFDEQSDVPQISHSPGFNPPAGIVHESLMNRGKKNKKRKVALSSDSEDENKIPRKKKSQSGEISSKKKGTRPRRDKMAKESDHKTVFIGNLPLTVKKKKLMNLMKDYGAIESIRYRCFAPNDPNMKKRVVAIKQNLHPDRHNCVAYVKFMTAESARKALACNGKKLDGLHLRVDMAARDQVRDIKKSVFVGNLPFDMEEDTVRSHFADCGTINNIRIVRDSKTSLGKGFCYINFNDTDAVAFALRLNGSKIAGRELRVMQCLPNPKKSVLERKKDKSKASKTSKQHSKKETKPQHIETEPFTVIDAGKLDAGKLSETVDQDNNDDEETPRKMSFAEKFEKKKQKRFEKVNSGKKDKNLSETESVKGEKKQKEKSGLENAKVKNKDKASFRKQKKQKLKKADSRTGSDRSKIFAKSVKKSGPNPPQRTKTFDGKPSGFRSNKPNVFNANKHEQFTPNKHSKPEQSSSNKHIKFDKAANKHIKFDKSDQSSAHKHKFNNSGNSRHKRTSTKPSEGIANTSIGKASKTSKQHSKKETKPQHIETEPFTVIDAGKLDAGKLSETVDQDNNDDEETPRKMSFAEKFEKKKQKRFEKVNSGKKDKNLSETESVKGEKKQKEKSGLENAKVKNKDKASFRKQKKQKLKKADSRTGSDRSKIFAKSVKKSGPNPPQRTKTFDGKPSGFRSNKPNVFNANKHEQFTPNKHSKPEQSSSNKHIKFDKAANKHIKFDKSDQSSAHKHKFNNSGNSRHKRTSTKPSEGIANTSIGKKTPKHIYFD